jgi:hypothetical protein
MTPTDNEKKQGYTNNWLNTIRKKMIEAVYAKKTLPAITAKLAQITKEAQDELSNRKGEIL